MGVTRHRHILSFLGVAVLITLGYVGYVGFLAIPVVHAAGIIEVNSTADTQANDGECTLREAIVAANTDIASGAAIGECAAGSGADTINFNITEASDFTNEGFNGYTIQPTSPLPEVTEQVAIDGYSQTDAKKNTAISPAPLNGILLVELNGDNIPGVTGLDFEAGSADSAVKGLVVNGFSSGVALSLNATGVVIQGSYVGTDASGLVSRSNLIGITSENSSQIGANAQIGGLIPEDRNLISSNTSSGGYPRGGWVFQGNYIGVDATGLSPLGNSEVGGAGGLSIDNAPDVIIGGTASGAANVISGNLNAALAPDHAPRLRIQGNFIGTGYDGTSPVPNGGGIGTANTVDAMIGGPSIAARNIIAFNSSGDGVFSQDSDNLTIQNNYIGVIADGVTHAGNGQMGILINGDVGDNILDNIVADNAGTGVVVSDSQSGNPSYAHTTDLTISDNTIEANGNKGIELSNASDITVNGNAIQDNASDGIYVNASTNAWIHSNTITGNYIGVYARANAQKIAITGNSISDSFNLGIDLSLNDGVTNNDVGDLDSGTNGLLNFPTNIVSSESGGNTDITYDLDVPAGQYRVEWFTNAAADGSGHGEGETFIDAQTITSSGSGSYSTTLSGVGYTNIAATVTEIDGATPSGYGATSEFSVSNTELVVEQDVAVTNTIVNPATVVVGGIIQYDITYRNNGPGNIELTSLNGTHFPSDNLFIDLLPDNLSFMSTISPSTVTCIPNGHGSSAGFGAGFAHHSSDVVVCSYTDATSHIIHSGQSITVRIAATVDSIPSEGFTNYVINIPGTLNDPDALALATIFGSGGEIVDGLLAAPVNNFAAAAYPLPTSPPTTTDSSSGPTLPSTGANINLPLTEGAGLILTGVVGLALRKRHFS